MVPRNLTWEEIVEDKTLIINKKRLEVRDIFKKDKRLREQKDFLQELVCKFVNKIVLIRERDNLNLLEITPEIKEIQDEVDRLEREIDQLSLQIQDTTGRGTRILMEIFNLRKELRQFINAHAVRNYAQN